MTGNINGNHSTAIGHNMLATVGPDGMTAFWRLSPVFDCVDVGTQRFVFDSATKTYLWRTYGRTARLVARDIARGIDKGLVRKVAGNVYELNSALFVVIRGATSDDVVQKKFEEGRRNVHKFAQKV